MPLELPADIASTIPPEHLSHESIQRYNSPADLIKGHIELQDYRGRSIGLPKQGEDVNKWRTETGEKLKSHGFTVAPLTDQPPATPDAYDFKIEGVDPEAIKTDVVVPAFRIWAHKQGMNNATANKILEFYNKEVVPMLANKFNEAQGEPVEMLEDDEQINKVMAERFKDEAPTRRDERDRAINTLSATIPDLKRLLNGTAPADDESKQWMAIKDHPAMVQLLSEVTRMQAQDFGGNVDGQVIQQDQLAAKKEADDIIGNKDNPEYSKYWKGDKAVQEKVESLYRKAHPGETFL